MTNGRPDYEFNCRIITNLVPELQLYKSAAHQSLLTSFILSATTCSNQPALKTINALASKALARLSIATRSILPKISHFSKPQWQHRRRPLPPPHKCKPRTTPLTSPGAQSTQNSISTQRPQMAPSPSIMSKRHQKVNLSVTSAT